MPVLEMVHDKDPKEVIWDGVKEYINDVHITGSQILIGIYVRPEKTKGGLFLTDNYRDEDKFQGKAGLILKLGSMDFDEDDKKFFGGRLPQVNDWVVYRPSHAFPVQFRNKVECRILEDARLIKAIVPAPDLVW